ncbi:MAG: aldehyde dehydrogenase family protein, partial [Verrucomicrobia bacterium]|nr:aldehyde dehydrogenase family protein [Verrucomicrobiota bacterium]
LFDAAATRRHPIPVFAEMSSLNPLFILPGAQAERGPAIAQGLLASFTLGVGQFCTKPGLIFVTRGPATYEFQQKLAELVRAAPCGTMLTSGIRDAFHENRARITAIPGVQILAAGGASPSDTRTESQPSVATTTAQNFIGHSALATEAFGPFTLVVIAEDAAELAACAAALDGQLTATVHGNAADLAAAGPLLAALERIAGRVAVNSFPTGVEVCHAMNHGGPYPATSDTRFTSVGTAAILRFARPVCYQGYPDASLPPALQNANPLGLMRLVDGKPTRESV